MCEDGVQASLTNKFADHGNEVVAHFVGKKAQEWDMELILSIMMLPVPEERNRDESAVLGPLVVQIHVAEVVWV